MNKPGHPIERIVVDPDVLNKHGMVRKPSAGEDYSHMSSVELWMISKPHYDLLESQLEASKITNDSLRRAIEVAKDDNSILAIACSSEFQRKHASELMVLGLTITQIERLKHYYEANTNERSEKI